MEQLVIDKNCCTGCGQCVSDCPMAVLSLSEGTPEMLAVEGRSCVKCQHCLAVCPTGALTIFGKSPPQSVSLNGALPTLAQMEQLYLGRRSIRKYRDENLDKGLLEHLLQLSWTAPSGVNARQVRLTLVDDRTVMEEVRSATYAGLTALFDRGAPAGLEMLAGYLQFYRETGQDVIYRGAPHLLIASAPKTCPTPIPDALIMLSYFELLAQSQGVGTVWCGLARMAIGDLLPELRERLGIPEDHLIGNAMVFGVPAVSYPRAVQHDPARIARVTELK